MPDRLIDRVYDGLYLLFSFLSTLFLSLKTKGRMRAPSSGPLLIISNHQSGLDPVLVSISIRRRIAYLARKSLFRKPLVAWMFRILRVVPLDQDRFGKEGLRTVIQLLEDGKAVLVFPEGTRTDDGKMNPFQPGIQLLIKRAKPTILPVGIAGAFQAWPHWRPYPLLSPLFLPDPSTAVAVCVGKPLDGHLYSHMPREKMLDDLHQRVNSLVQQAEELRRKK